jgi:cobalt-precorrin 5A hydrolase
MSARVAIGVGCRLGCPADAIEALVRQALVRAARVRQDCQGPDRQLQDGQPPAEWAALFTIEDKAGEKGLIEAAGCLGLSLTFLPRDALRQRLPFIQTPSIRAKNLFGVPSVAEAAALAGAGANGELILPRISGRGVTCAIAGSRSDP